MKGILAIALLTAGCATAPDPNPYYRVGLVPGVLSFSNTSVMTGLTVCYPARLGGGLFGGIERFGAKVNNFDASWVTFTYSKTNDRIDLEQVTDDEVQLTVWSDVDERGAALYKSVARYVEYGMNGYCDAN